jgi:hypothetical protein
VQPTTNKAAATVGASWHHPLPQALVAAMIDDRSIPSSYLASCSSLSGFGGGAAQQEGCANRHGQCRYGADGSAEVNTLSDRLLLGDPDRSG